MIKQIGRLIAADLGKQIEILDEDERVVMAGELRSAWHQHQLTFITEPKLRTQVTLGLRAGGTLIHTFDHDVLVRTPA